MPFLMTFNVQVTPLRRTLASSP